MNIWTIWIKKVVFKSMMILRRISLRFRSPRFHPLEKQQLINMVEISGKIILNFAGDLSLRTDNGPNITLKKCNIFRNSSSHPQKKRRFLVFGIFTHPSHTILNFAYNEFSLYTDSAPNDISIKKLMSPWCDHVMPKGRHQCLFSLPPIRVLPLSPSVQLIQNSG